MQRSDLEAEIGRLCGDPNNVRWSTTLIDTRLEEAQKAVQIDTGAVKTVETFTPVVGQSAYSLSTSLLDVLRATITDSSGNVNELTGRTIEDLWYRRPLWKNETNGTPDTFYIDYSTNTINLVCPPASGSANVNGLVVTEVQTPAAMSSGTSIPFGSNNLMVPYHRILCYWVASENMKDNNDNDSLNKALFFRSGNLDKPGQYEFYVKKILSLFDSPSDARARILWSPQGGRLGGWPVSKSTPLG